MTFHLTDTWRKGYNNLFDTLEHFILDFEEVEDNEVDEATKCTWLTATLKVSKKYIKLPFPMEQQLRQQCVF
jgi:hypothetical protein